MLRGKVVGLRIAPAPAAPAWSGHRTSGADRPYEGRRAVRSFAAGLPDHTQIS